MTNRERLMAIFRGDVPDRPALKLWAARPGMKLIHPDYEPVYALAMETSDLVGSSASPFNVYWGKAAAGISESEERPTGSEEWVDVVTRFHTPEGTLQTVHTRSTVGKPGYIKEHPLKEPDDIRKLLSVPYEPMPFATEAFDAADAAIGDRGITLFGLDHPMYALERLIGSENFALWSITDRDLLVDTIGIFADRIREHAERAVSHRLQCVYGWCGPELCIPPLMSPADFDEMVGQFDKPIIDVVHEGGAYMWVHSHGKMGPVLERFADMGTDVLNPIEPPPMGDITLSEAFARVGDRMGLEGNIETHDLMTATPERICELVEQAIEAGKGRRLILCPSSGFMEWPYPTERTITNLLTYLKEGLRCAQSVSR